MLNSITLNVKTIASYWHNASDCDRFLRMI